jgi:hypothetical protein
MLRNCQATPLNLSSRPLHILSKSFPINAFESVITPLDAILPGHWYQKKTRKKEELRIKKEAG